MDSNLEFYVYRWIRLDTNTPFYVGKGKGDRFTQTRTGRNKYFRNILKKSKCEVEIIIHSLSEDQAFAKEIEFIQIYKSLGYCEANLTLGGDGTCGLKHSQESKDKISNALKGKPYLKSNLGKKLSTEVKQKLSESLKGRPGVNLGKKASVSTRQKMSESAKGRVFSDEHRNKIGLANKRRKLSEETKTKISNKQKAYQQLKRQAA